jgi:hypothetical protein
LRTIASNHGGRSNVPVLPAEISGAEKAPGTSSFGNVFFKLSAYPSYKTNDLVCGTGVHTSSTLSIQMIMQFVSLGMLLSGALITYKVLILVSNSESPIVCFIFMLMKARQAAQYFAIFNALPVPPALMTAHAAILRSLFLAEAWSRAFIEVISLF